MTDPSLPETVVLNERRESAPPRPRAVGAWKAPAVIGAFLLAALASAGAGIALGSGADELTAAEIAAPEVGVCRTYDARAALAATNDSPAVPCDAPHTAQTFAVPEALPDPLADGTWGEDEAQEVVDAGCGSQVAADSLGISTTRFETSRLIVVFFTPTAPQAQAGARWVRCDLVLLESGRLASVTGPFDELVKPEGAFATCFDPASTRQTAVRCADDPDLLAIVGTVPVESNGTAEDAEAIRASCTALAREQSDVADPRVEVTLPTPAQFRLGRTFATCLLQADQWDVDRDAWPAETGAASPSDDIRSV